MWPKGNYFCCISLWIIKLILGLYSELSQPYTCTLHGEESGSRKNAVLGENVLCSHGVRCWAEKLGKIYQCNMAVYRSNVAMYWSNVAIYQLYMVIYWNNTSIYQCNVMLLISPLINKIIQHQTVCRVGLVYHHLQEYINAIWIYINIFI